MNQIQVPPVIPPVIPPLQAAVNVVPAKAARRKNIDPLTKARLLRFFIRLGKAVHNK